MKITHAKVISKKGMKKQSSKIGKDLQHYLTSQEMKGGKDELNKRILDYINRSINNGIDVKCDSFEKP